MILSLHLDKENFGKAFNGQPFIGITNTIALATAMGQQDADSHYFSIGIDCRFFHVVAKDMPNDVVTVTPLEHEKKENKIEIVSGGITPSFGVKK